MKIPKTPWLLKLLVSVLILIFIFLLYPGLINKEELPVYNPSDLNPKLVDLSLQSTDSDHTVGPFNLINQNGEKITEMDYEDKIYVTDFFFTRCLTVCPVMTNNMEKLQAEFINDEDIKLLSISVTPAYDSVPVLKNYAAMHDVIQGKWNITTGNKRHIYELARKNYFAAVDQGDGGLQDFIHTPNFVLVDKKKQIRGIYDGTREEEIQRLIKDIRTLRQ